MRFRRGVASAFWFAVILTVLIGAGAAAAFTYKPAAPKVTDLQIGGKIGVSIGIKVYGPDGALKSSFYDPDDLILDNFRTFLAEWFSDDTTMPVTASLKNDLNQAKTVNVKVDRSSWANNIGDSNTGSGKKGGVIGIGTGTTAPQRTNYKLETPTEADTYITAGYPTWSAVTGNVTISASVAITGAHDITEAVLGVNWVAADASENTFNMFRDTFPAISVVNLDVVVITYQIQLTGDEFTSNFGNFLAQMFATIDDGGAQTGASCTPVTGTPYTMKFYYNVDTLGAFTSTYTVSPRLPTSIATGTSNAAPARTQYGLTGQVEIYTVPNPHPSTAAATTVVVQTDIVCSVQRNLQEGGLFVECHTALNARFLFIRDTFSLEPIPSGNSIWITFTLTC